LVAPNENRFDNRNKKSPEGKRTMVGFLESPELAENYTRCKEYTRQHAKTFYFASHVLPRQKRMAAYAVYSFCRYADNVVDAAASPGDIHRSLVRLNGLRDQLRYVYTYSPLMNPKLMAFRDTVTRYRIPMEYFLDLLRGLGMDITRQRYETFEELHEYCYCVASVVGLIMATIFGVRDEIALAHAVDLGTAMQLTNILRDIGEDYRMGRMYIPREDLDRFHCTEWQIRNGLADESFRAMMQFQIARARAYYARAAQGIPMLSNDGSRFCVRLMGNTYARILTAIERKRYDVFATRAYVPLARKCWIAVRSMVGSGTPVRRDQPIDPDVRLFPRPRRYADAATLVRSEGV
jgi:15-cis-phytoene synthase